jgi:hypothetical protein
MNTQAVNLNASPFQPTHWSPKVEMHAEYSMRFIGTVDTVLVQIEKKITYCRVPNGATRKSRIFFLARVLNWAIAGPVFALNSTRRRPFTKLVPSHTIVQPGVQTHPELQNHISCLIPASFCPRTFCP